MQFNGEEEALETVDKLAKQYGYGNVITFLQNRWAQKLMKDLPAETAARAAFMTDIHTEEFVRGHRR